MRARGRRAMRGMTRAMRGMDDGYLYVYVVRSVVGCGEARARERARAPGRDGVLVRVTDDDDFRAQTCTA